MTLRTPLIILFSLSFLFPACEFRCSIGESSSGVEKSKPVQKDGMALYNGIRLETNGVQVNKAYLVTHDDRAERISEDNFIELQNGVRLILLIDSGWKATHDRVWLGASMKVTTDTGEEILDQEDLFSKFDQEGISAEDAKVIALSVSLSGLKPGRPVSFHVRFNVWDKKGDGRIKGGYTVHTK